MTLEYTKKVIEHFTQRKINFSSIKCFTKEV